MSRPEISRSDATGLISVKDACELSGEKPAVIIGYCVHDKIGRHVKAGLVGTWMVDPDALERLLAKRGAAS